MGQLHEETIDDAPILHRNLTPGTVLVRHDNTPIFTGFELSRIPSERSVGSAGPPAGEWLPSTAPEVRAQGLHAADARSDRYELCASLRALFEDRDDEPSRQALEVLASGMADDPAQRSEPSALDARLSALLGESPPVPPSPPARFWTEDQIVRFGGERYRVVERLGAGGVGTAFKVVQLDRTGQEELGTYVAKVCHDEEAGRRAVNAYRLARSHLQHQAVSGIFEVASEWRENEFTALMTWVEGSPLRDFAGVLPLLVDDLDETSADALTLFWLRTMCEALDVLHRNGLVHGDVNPGNLIVSGRDLVLTDYDFVGRIGEPIAAPGALLYCSPSHQASRAASPSDDLYALAASFFHVIFEHEPFRYDGAPAKDRGLNWEAVDAERRAEYRAVAAFLDRATDPDPDRRFPSATEALKALKATPTDSPAPETPIPTISPAPEAPAPAVSPATEPSGPAVPPLAVAGPESPAAGPAPVPAPPATEPAAVPAPSAAPVPAAGSSTEGPATLPASSATEPAAARESSAAVPAPAPSAEGPAPEAPVEAPEAGTVRREAQVAWLRSLLQSYPGSRWGNRETRGLDSEFAEQTYVETPLETALHDDVRARRVRLVVLCGNAGDGKTALLQHLVQRFGLERRASSERVLEGQMDDGLRVRMNLDGSASWHGRSADDLLDEFLTPFRDGPPADDIAHLLAINDGRLLEWIERVERREGETALTRALYDAFQRVQRDRWTGAPAAAGYGDGEYDEGDGEHDDEDAGGDGDAAGRRTEDAGAPAAAQDAQEYADENAGGGGDATEHAEGADTAEDAEGTADAAPQAPPDAHIRFVNLNQRSLVGGVSADGTGIETRFLERLVDRLYGGSRAAEIWAPCSTCSAQDRCRVFQANRLFGPAGLPGGADDDARSRARGRLFEALQAVHLRGETHVTVRELRAALVYVLFGVHFCDDYHAGAAAAHRPAAPAYWDPDFGPFPEAAAEAGLAPLPYWDRAFDPQSPGRQGAVLGDLARFDPALDAHPRIDRHLVRPTQAGTRRGVPRYPELELPSARRRAYFEWLERDIESITGEPHALDLAHGRHLRLFRRLPVDAAAREAARRALCAGIARLATLPPQAYDQPGVVPLRITPRTPTETAFWIEKPADRFRLEADLPPAPPGVDRLHRQATLVYRYADGGEEPLRLGAELFHLLLELSDGYQLGDASTDDTFAHLSIFVQRLEREDDRRLLAWNPMREDAIHEIAAESGSGGGPQRLVIRPLA